MSTTAEIHKPNLTADHGSFHIRDWFPIIGILIGVVPLVAAHFYELWQEPQYQYFPFVLAGVGYLIWSRIGFAAVVPEETRSQRSQLRSLLFVCWCILALGVALYDPWLGMLSLILVLGLAAYQLSGRRKITNMLGIWCLLWLILPLPLDLDKSLVQSLQLLSSKMSSLILDLIHVNHLMTGNVLELPDKSLFVDEACSGIVSVMAVITCSAIYSVWVNRSLPHTLLLLVASVGWAVLLNVVRISAIAVAQAWWTFDLSSGTSHEILGLSLFAITFVAMISTDQILAFALAPIQLVGLPEDVRTNNFLISGWNVLTTTLTPQTSLPPNEDLHRDEIAFGPPFSGWNWMGGAFAILGVVHLLIWGVASAPSSAAVERAHQLEQTVLPTAFANWKQEAFETIHREENLEYGEFSKAFRYTHAKSNTVVNISIDFPFQGSWHELSYCYNASGWGSPDRTVVDESKNPSLDNWNYIEAKYKRPDGRLGHLLYAVFDGSGDLVSPPASPLKERFWRRMRRRGPSSTWPQMLQVQAWTESDAEISEELSGEILNLFLESRRILHSAVSVAQ